MSRFRRSVSRAGVLALAAVSFACGDSTGPLNLEPEQLEAVGESIALELESSALTLTSSGAMGEAEQSPSFALGSRTSRRVLGDGASYNLSRVGQIGSTECGVPSQDPPTDSDQDGVPDNLTITFALPACHTETQFGSFDITGVFRISDPTPGTAGFALNFGMDDFRIVMSGQEGTATINRDGTSSVTASSTGLSQAQNWVESASFSGHPRIGASIDWTATFAAEQGSSIVVGQPLPNGAYSPNGTFRYSEGKRAAVLNVTTVSPLQYNAECAAMVLEGLADSPFTGGQVNVAFSGTDGSGYVRITYANCSWASVVFIGAN